MKMMKNISLTALLSLAMFGTVTFSSCSRDECKDVVCQNGGTCDETDGSCTCATGFEGDLCQTRVADKFVGTWTATETCGGVNQPSYQVTITAAGSATPSQILLANLGNYNCTVGGNITFTGNVSGSTTFTINDNKCSTQMIANGTLNSNGSITITYTATYAGGSDNCTATLTK
jgi:hypothetical protein